LEVNVSFEPYIARGRFFRDLTFDFFISDKVGAEWYGGSNQSLPEREWVFDRVLKGMTIVDCGCHHGMMSVLFALHAGASGKVFAFDALPDNIAAVRRNAQLNGLENITAKAVALGHRCGHGWVSLNSGNAVVQKSPARDGLEIALSRLDDEISPDVRIDFLKIDVEGFEFEVMRGARRILAHKPIIDLEIHNFIHRGSCLAPIRRQLLGLGYNFYVQETIGVSPHGPHNDFDISAIAVFDNPHIYCVPVVRRRRWFERLRTFHR
jgi:FkbM family methyltransferase